MATQRDAAKLYTDLQAQTAEQVSAKEARTAAQLTAERVRLAEMREARETRREIEAEQADRQAAAAEQAHLNAEDRSRMGAVVWVVGAACLALIAFLLPWAALVQWAATGDTARYVRALLAFGALIVGGLLWRARK